MTLGLLDEHPLVPVAARPVGIELRGADASDDPFELGGSLEAALAHWTDECKAQDGTVILPHFPAPNGDPASLIATGRVDAIELISDTSAFLEEYYRYLNCGYGLPLVGGTDEMSSDVPVGLYRTYVHIPDGELEYGSCAATCARGGPS